MITKKPKILVVLGPTASGKSDLAVQLAKKYNGEIISADSRQVYKGLDIGTGKITKKEMRGVPHHLLDVASPRRRFSVAQYKKLGEKAIEKILKKNKLPIICGGTGFYIDALLGDVDLPEVKPNLALRKQLETKPATELFNILKNLDPERAEAIDNKNPRRLIRAIEIAVALGKVPHFAKATRGKYDVLKIGIEFSDEELKERINKRLKKRIKNGMIEEAEKLHKEGLSYKKMRELGLEYRRLADYLDRKISKEEMIERLQIEIWQYAKRQKTWFKRSARNEFHSGGDKNIHWINLDNVKSIESEIEQFIG